MTTLRVGYVSMLDYVTASSRFPGKVTSAVALDVIKKPHSDIIAMRTTPDQKPTNSMTQRIY
jgi:hypothetical protein